MDAQTGSEFGESGDTDPGIGVDVDRLGRLHLLIGRYISEINGIEQELHRGIASYFGHPPKSSEKFCSWLLARIETSEVVQISRQIAEDCSLKDYFDPTFKALLGAIKFRNLIAHGHLGLGSPPSSLSRDEDGVPLLDIEGFRYMFNNPTVRTPHRKNLQETLADEADFEQRLSDLNVLSTMVLRFLLAMIMRNGGSDAGESLRSFDENNPELPRLDVVPEYLRS